MEPSSTIAGEWAPNGALTISRISELKEQLSETLATFDQVRVDLSRVTAVDASFLQLLCSVHRTAGASGKGVALVGSTAGFLEAAAEAGFHRHIGCALACSDSCIWVLPTSNSDREEWL